MTVCFRKAILHVFNEKDGQPVKFYIADYYSWCKEVTLNYNATIRFVKATQAQREHANSIENALTRIQTQNLQDCISIFEYFDFM